ncbi:uncharacterized protein LOC114720839 [Neltuma alba]|uniref:uncharacterized protein LOC114720839 n=1 Tax=Neltuma alba TaxID=207710 RepID=UPI0010A4506D|nr:uncharacterized protein LOC114720839 [Prosopis alba]
MDQYQNHQHFPDDDSMDPDKFIESFNLASCAEEKRHEFDLQYSVSYTQRLIQEHLGISVVQDLAFSSSAASSSFQMLQQTIDQLAPHHAGSEQNMPQFWKDLIKMSDPQVRQKPAAETSLARIL